MVFSNISNKSYDNIEKRFIYWYVGSCAYKQLALIGIVEKENLFKVN
jgi:hypothetical protein